MTAETKSMTRRSNRRAQAIAGTVAAGFAAGLVRFTASKGLDRSRLAKEAGLDLAALNDPDGRIPVDAYLRLIRAAKRLCNDDALALRFGEGCELGEMSIVGLLGSAPMTFNDAVALLNRYSSLSADLQNGSRERFELSQNKDGVWLTDHRSTPNDSLELTESTFARMAAGLRSRFLGTPVLKAVHVTHAAPAYRAVYDRVFGVSVVFDSDRNALLMEKDVLHRVVAVDSSDYASHIFRGHAESLLEQMNNRRTTRGLVEHAIVQLLHKTKPTIATVARELRLSRQTLHRRLKSEGVTFEQVFDEVRKRLAIDFMAARNRSVSETAYALRFSEPGAFSRAFKRWTGIRPSSYLAGRSRPT